MICFEFIIFALSITALTLLSVLFLLLWFASNLLFLHYQSQLDEQIWYDLHCCDLLRIYYFCTINHSQFRTSIINRLVVICFEFIIFALSITALSESSKGRYTLWFASNLLFLHYQSQQNGFGYYSLMCCDLLRIYYFCTINHSRLPYRGGIVFVVICFEFIIFALSITAIFLDPGGSHGLWFASNLLFLHYQSQPSRTATTSNSTLWFASNLLFLHYQSQHQSRTCAVVGRCDLLRIYYFCTINHSYRHQEDDLTEVVICFEFIIFALSITAQTPPAPQVSALWFASNLLFLHYQSQLLSAAEQASSSCDLLRIYYFCTINHSPQKMNLRSRNVVICFEFIIFALSITA